MSRIIIHKPVSKEALQAVAQVKLAFLAKTAFTQHYTALEVDNSATAASLASALTAAFTTDVTVLPDSFVPQEVRLLITDMDSTLISIECIDEIADFIGCKAEVSNITEAAMRGDIDFKQSLTQRVSLLKGLKENILDDVYNDRLNLNAGAETLIKGLKKCNIQTALVSGGFTFFTERLKTRLGLDFTQANQLEIINGQLTGKVLGNIVDASAKAKFLQGLCQKLKIRLNQTIAVGDGANDLAMMRIAGLSIAYHAKPTVQQQAQAQLNHCGLDAILHLVNSDHSAS